MRLGEVPAVRVHPTLGEPCLCGVLRPVILLPGRWLATAGADGLDAVLAHELAHARRLDHLVNLALRLLETLLFFHPGIHWLSRRLRLERELCADALAARLTADPLALARALESVARLRLAPAFPAPLGAALTLGGGRESLLPRIQELIGMTPIRPRTRVWPFLVLPSALAIGLLAASLGLAEDDPRPSPPQPKPAPAPALLGAGTESLISYEVRFLTNEPAFLCERLTSRGRVETVKLDHDVSGWIIDAKVDAALRKSKEGDHAASQIRAPKVTTVENANATIFIDPRSQQPLLSKEEAEREWSASVDVRGSFTPQGVRLSLDLTSEAQGRADGARISIGCSGSCDIPEGSSLAVRLWLIEFADQSTCERLVVITPRRIRMQPRAETPAPKTRPAPPQSSTP